MEGEVDGDADGTTEGATEVKELAVTTLLSKLTAADTDMTGPATACVLTVTAASAMTVPTITLVVPRVALLPTFQKTLTVEPSVGRLLKTT